MRITILGNGGSGKTSLAFRIQTITQLPLYHLDQYYWQPQWQRSPDTLFAHTLTQLCAQPYWIIEGSYMRFLEPRLKNADLIIILDIPRYICLWRVIKRTLIYLGKEIPGSPTGCMQRLLSSEFIAFLRWVVSYKKRNREQLRNVTQEYNHKVIILKSTKEISQFLHQLEQKSNGTIS